MTESMALVLQAKQGEDLLSLSQWLWHQRIPHRIAENVNTQELWAASRHIQQVCFWYQEFQAGRLPALPKRSRPTPNNASSSGFLAVAYQQPLTIALLLAAALGFVVTEAKWWWFLEGLAFYQWDTTVGDWRPWVQPFQEGQLWRLVTPTFLHFGLIHWLFNSLWLWLLGGLCERRWGWGRLLSIVLVTSLGANLLQAVWQPYQLFGGLSGVIYGLLGYCWVWQYRTSRAGFELPVGLYGMMFGFLLLGAAGALDWLLPGGGSVANAAHLGGLLAGLALASRDIGKTHHH